jgi:uncharacterized protein (TIRG00374 family)
MNKIRNVRVHPRVAVILKILVAVGLIVALVVYIDVDALRQSVLHANILYLIIGTVLVVANTGLEFLRWRYLVRLIASGISNKDIFSSLFIGISAGFFTPGQVGEHGGRMVTLSPLPAIQVLAVSIIDKLYNLAVTVIAGVIAAWLYFIIYLPQYWTPWLTAVVIVVVISFLIIVLYPDLLKQILRVLLHRFRKYRAVSSFLFMKDVFHRRQARFLLILTMLLYIVIILQYHFFVIAFEPVSLGVSALCTANLLFTKSVILPISFSDLGVRESTAIFFFSRAGVSAASAFNASICIFFVNIFFPSLLGSLLILRIKSAKQKGSS